ncbi:MAG: hypothetical protein J6O50_02245 [Ruminiclostridium sp.]|nr:hypothetical protein [Ruminiclostridium sp.]
MKINKILAAGVAATLAVTSLSAVASAEVQTKTFDVYRTTAEFWSHSIKFNADVNKNIAQRLRQATTGKIAITQIEKFLRDDLAYQGFINYLISEGETTKAAEYAADKTKLYNGSDLMIGGISITATGYQHIGDTATVTKTFKFQREPNAADATEAQKGYSCREWWGHNGANKPWILTVLDDKTPIYHDGEFASYFFTEITSLQLEVQINGVTADEEEYNYWTSIGTRDALKRWMDIGDIAVYENSTDTTPLYTYGYYTHTDDYDTILAAQAKQETTSWVAGDADPNTTKGYVIGTLASGGVYPRAAASTQNLYTGTESEGLVLSVAEVAQDGNATAITAQDTYKVSDVSDTIVFVGTTDVSSRQIVSITGGAANVAVTFYIVPSKTLTTDQLAAIKAAVAKAEIPQEGVTAAALQTKLAALKLKETDTAEIDKNIKVYDAADKAPILLAVSKDDYQSIEISADTAGGGNGGDEPFFEKGEAILATIVNNTVTYSLNSSNVFGQAFGTMNYDDAISTAHLLAYAFANGGWYESKAIYGDNDNATANDSGLVGTLNPATKKTNGWLPKTTNGGRKQVKNLIERTDALLLSKTGEHTSDGVGYGSYGSDANQSYNATFWEGTNPYGFAGLASQVADFFNKQDNGTITFTFAADAGNTAGKWNDGVPSTEVGLKGFSSEYLNDFALFFNYSNTTGTMLSAIKADPTSGTATFDISDYLKDCGGLTKATLENIYYGLDNGIRKAADSNLYGFWVSKVELAYDDAGKAAVDATTDDDTAEDDAAVVVADDDDDDAKVEDDDIFEDDDVIEDDDDDDDDVDADVIEDDDDDDTDVNNDVDYVDAGADDDANPGTGVGLAVIPAIVAAAAVVVSKKRK